MRATTLLFLLAAVAGCGKKPDPTAPSLAPPPIVVQKKGEEPAPAVKEQPKPPVKEPAPVDPDLELKKNAKDMGEYTAKLKETVQIFIADFTKKGFKAQSYEKDPKVDTMFLTIMLKVEPVYLKDTITGETKRYTRARMFRNTPRIGSGQVYEWSEITMMP